MEEIERQERSIKGSRDHIKDIYATAKAKGYDVKALRRYVSYRKKDPQKLADQEAMFQFYKDVLEPLLPMFDQGAEPIEISFKAS